MSLKKYHANGSSSRNRADTTLASPYPRSLSLQPSRHHAVFRLVANRTGHLRGRMHVENETTRCCFHTRSNSLAFRLPPFRIVRKEKTLAQQENPPCKPAGRDCRPKQNRRRTRRQRRLPNLLGRNPRPNPPRLRTPLLQRLHSAMADRHLRSRQLPDLQACSFHQHTFDTGIHQPARSSAPRLRSHCPPGHRVGQDPSLLLDLTWLEHEFHAFVQVYYEWTVALGLL